MWVVFVGRWRAAGGWGVDGMGEPCGGVVFCGSRRSFLFEKILDWTLCTGICGCDTWLPGLTIMRSQSENWGF